MTERVADALGVRGPRITVSTACTSSTNALGLALDLLAMGAADAVLAGGADVLTPLVLSGFQALGVLSQQRCAPFSRPAGTSLGEGAGFLVLEPPAAAARRGAEGRLALHGCGLGADAFHDTGPDPTGAGVARAMRAAMRDAGVPADQIGYVNAHGTGTVANDPAEWRAIRQVFGPRAEALPVSSSKGFLGHAQGAAGALEVITTLLAMEQGSLPPTRNFAGARPNSPPDPVAQEQPRSHACQLALCNNSAFGGANCAVVVGAAGAAQPGPALAARSIYVAGVSALGPHGISLDALADALTPGAPPKTGHVPRFRLEDVVPSADPRGLDPCSRYVTAAAALALGDAGVKLRGSTRERTGLVAGVNRVSHESHTALLDSIDRRGLRFLSAPLFSRMVLNAPVGSCSRLLGLKGPLSTVSAGGASGLVAIAYAAELLATRDEADRLVAGAVEELAPDADGDSEGAACLVLDLDLPPPAARARRVRLAGWGLSGPGGLAAAASAALDRAGLAASEVDLVVGPDAARLPRAGELDFSHARRLDPSAHLGQTGAAASALAAAAAALLLRRGSAACALVVATGGASADAALCLVAEPAPEPAPGAHAHA